MSFSLYIDKIQFYYDLYLNEISLVAKKYLVSIIKDLVADLVNFPLDEEFDDGKDN